MAINTRAACDDSISDRILGSEFTSSVADGKSDQKSSFTQKKSSQTFQVCRGHQNAEQELHKRFLIVSIDCNGLSQQHDGAGGVRLGQFREQLQRLYTTKGMKLWNSE